MFCSSFGFLKIFANSIIEFTVAANLCKHYWIISFCFLNDNLFFSFDELILFSLKKTFHLIGV